MPRGVALADIHPSVEAGVNNRDLDGLMALYAPDASLVLPDGSTITGTEAIREAYAGLIEMGGRMTVRSRYAIEAGDLAVLSNEWSWTAGDQAMGAVTAEVARRQPDGGWLYVVDHPFAGLEADELAALAAELAG
jgi:ketosteroid isomerase-like protein